MLGRLLGIGLIWVPACYRAPEPACGFACGPDNACPADYTCGAQHVCRPNGASQATDCPHLIDAAVDALIDAPIDAEPPPQVVSVMPPNMAQGVAVDTMIVATFNEAIVGYDLQSAFVAAQFNYGLPATLTFDTATNQLRMQLHVQLQPNADVDVAIKDNTITNTAGVPLPQYRWVFITGDDTLPPHATPVPANGATQVAVTSTIQVTFDERVTGVDPTSFTVAAGGTPIAGAITQQNGPNMQTYTFTPTAALPAATTITVALSSTIQDTSGNALPATTFSFATE